MISAPTEGRKVSIRTEKRTTVTLSEAQIEKLVREAVGAPSGALVAFDTGHDYLNEVRVSWTDVEENEAP